MNQHNRNMVMAYLAQNKIIPLIFKGYTSSVEEFNPEKHSITEMVKRAMTLTKDYASTDINGEWESSSERWRSVLDIWRHIIYYYPNVEIFDVMHSLFEIKNECGGQYCHEVRRRTFKLASAYQHYNWSNLQMGIDEFGLSFDAWEDI